MHIIQVFGLLALTDTVHNSVGEVGREVVYSPVDTILRWMERVCFVGCIAMAVVG